MEKPPVIEEGEAPKPKQKIDKSVFELAEQNLDLIEQAKKEEFVPKHPSLPPKKEKEGGQVIIKRRRTVLKFFYLLLALIVIVGGFWVYKSKFYKKIGIKIPSRSEVTKVAEKIPEVVGETKKIGESVIVSSKEAMQQAVVASEISEQYITQILIGKNVLDVSLKLFQSFPQNARLQYLRVKSNKLSFILYLPTRDEGYTFKNNIVNNPRFLSPDVFYIERDESNLNAPYQIMTILRYKDTISRSSSVFGFKLDNELAQIIGTIGQSSNVFLTPIEIFKAQNNLPRKAQFSGKGSFMDCIRFYKKIMDMNVNIGIECVYVDDNSNQKLENTQLNFRIDAEIFPRKP
ncbi:MAG: hypothetical protein KAW56_17580 [Candidatus Marinimicrobia bacterium]|nr:hypothetical protein [Candidatus Neomarinimicrobiota bacterium]